MVMKIITWSGEGFITKLKSETQIDVDAECIKFDKYLELLKYSFYLCFKKLRCCCGLLRLRKPTLLSLINSETPTSISGCSDFHFGGGRLPHRSLDVQLKLNEFTGKWEDQINGL